MLTNSYSGGVRQGLRRRRQHRDQERHQRAPRQRLRLLPRRGAQREGPLREVRRLRQRPSTARRRPTARSSGAATLGGPVRKDKTFFFLSFERLDVEANNFVNIDPGGGGRAATAPASRSSWATSRTRSSTTRPWARSTTSGAANHSLVLRGNFSDTTNENIEPFGGHRGAQPRRGAAPQGLVALAPPQTDVLSPRWVNEARVQFARQDQDDQLARPQLRRALRRRSDQGGPTLEVTGVAQRRPAALHAAARGSTTASSSPRRSSFAAGAPLR